MDHRVSVENIGTDNEPLFVFVFVSLGVKCQSMKRK